MTTTPNAPDAALLWARESVIKRFGIDEYHASIVRAGQLFVGDCEREAEAHRAGQSHAAEPMLDEIERLRAENEKLRRDLKAAISGEPVAGCEGCSAPLFEGDDFVSDPDGDCSGCWAAMTDLPSKRERPCYAYRVGKVPAASRPVVMKNQDVNSQDSPSPSHPF